MKSRMKIFVVGALLLIMSITLAWAGTMDVIVTKQLASEPPPAIEEPLPAPLEQPETAGAVVLRGEPHCEYGELRYSTTYGDWYLGATLNCMHSVMGGVDHRMDRIVYNTASCSACAYSNTWTSAESNVVCKRGPG